VQTLVVERQNAVEGDAPGIDRRIEDLAEADGKLAAEAVQALDRVVVLEEGPCRRIEPLARGARAEVATVRERAVGLERAPGKCAVDGIQHVPTVERFDDEPLRAKP
jgi:hypothetical protein